MITGPHQAPGKHEERHRGREEAPVVQGPRLGGGVLQAAQAAHPAQGTGSSSSCVPRDGTRLEMAQTMAWSENSRLSRQSQTVPKVSDFYDCCGRDFTRANPRV